MSLSLSNPGSKDVRKLMHILSFSITRQLWPTGVSLLLNLSINQRQLIHSSTKKPRRGWRKPESDGVVAEDFDAVWEARIALRGHRDDHIVWIDEEEFEAENKGNSIELVHFWAETDDILCRHLHNGPSIARYPSKTVHNELISIIGHRIRTDILTEVKQAKSLQMR